MTRHENSALEGRMPVLPHERIFRAWLPFLWSCTIFSAGIGALLVGPVLAHLGDIRVTIPGYLIGVVIGFVPAALGGGLPSFRYGIDPMDAAKATFGRRGIAIPTVGLIGCALAWSCIYTSFIAHSGATLLAAPTSSSPSPTTEWTIGGTVIVMTWILVQRGPQFIEKVNNLAGPVLLLTTVLLLVLLIVHVGTSHLSMGTKPSSGWLFPDRTIALVSAIELGAGSALSNWPFLGGITRLVSNRRHLFTPALLGTSLVGAGLGASIAAVVASSLSSDDPIAWLLVLGGPKIGGIAAMTVLICSIAGSGMLIYLASVSAQQVGWIRRLRWGWIVAIAMTPAAFATIHPETAIAAVASVVNYQALVFVGIAGVTFCQYFIVLRQRLQLASIFTRDKRGAYAYWFGVNWIAVFGALVGSATYIYLYNPLTLEFRPAFCALGATIPALIASILSFLLLTSLCGKRHQPIPASKELDVDL